MLKWPTLNHEQKAKTYSEYCSHEFNVFLKLKDTIFFENAVKPFIANKIEKTFVDYWLLGYTAQMREFLQPHSNKTFIIINIELTELNVFEQCLLIHSLV